MPKPLYLRFRYTEQDYVRAMRLHLSRRMHLKLGAATALAASLLCVLMLQDGARPEWLWGIGFLGAVILLAIILFAWFILPARVYRDDPRLHDEYFLLFGPEGVEFRTANIHSHVAWKLFRTLRSDGHIHLLVHGGSGFTALPRRAFTGTEQEAAILQLVRTSVGASPTGQVP